MTETEQLQEDMVRRAEIGIEAESFLRSRLGKHLLRKADEERANWLDRLIEADPEDAKLQRSIRLELKAIDSTIKWLMEAINAGDSAREQLSTLEAETQDY